MRAFFRLIALFTAVVFVITAVAALFTVNLVQVATSRNALKLSLGSFSTTMVESAPGLVVDTVRAQAAAQGVVLPQFNEAAMEVALAEVIPEEWVELQADTAVDAVFDALETGSLEAASVEFDLAPVITNLRGEQGEAAIGALMASLPDCPEAADGPVDFLSGTIELPQCVPPNVDRGTASQEIHMLLVETLDANPQLVQQADAVSVTLFDSGTTAAARQAEQDFARLSRTFQLAQSWSWLLWLLPVGCLLLIAVLAVRSWRDLGLWWGWPMVVASVVALVLVFLVPALTTWLWRTAVVLPIDPALANVAMEELMAQLVRQLTLLWRGRVLWESGVVLLAGGLLVVVGYLSPRRVESAW